MKEQNEKYLTIKELLWELKERGLPNSAKTFDNKRKLFQKHKIKINPICKRYLLSEVLKALENLEEIKNAFK